MMNVNEVHEQIRVFKRIRGFTIIQIAKDCKLSRSMVQRFVAGDNHNMIILLWFIEHGFKIGVNYYENKGYFSD